MKITIVGGGSVAWAPKLMCDFLLDPFFEGAEIALMDINQDALNNVLDRCAMLQKQANVNLTITSTTDLEESIKNTNYVIPAVAIGGFEADIHDHNIAREAGYWNIKGHDIGGAGFSRVLRHTPFMVHMARLMEKVAAPGAMLLNVSNPLVANTMAVYKYSKIKSYGFCHGVHAHLMPLVELLGAETFSDIEWVTTGLDHCSWLLDVRVKGKDALETLREKGVIAAAYRNASTVEVDDPFAGRETERLRFIIWDQLGYFPAIGDAHICEFLPQFIKTPEARKHWDLTYDRLIERKKTIEGDVERHKKIMSGEMAEELTAGGESVARFIKALGGGGSYVDIMNAPNIGQIPNLPESLLVETKCYISSNGVHPLAVGPLPDVLESIVRPVLIHEKMYMEAAYDWDKEKALAALSTDPIVSDFINARDVVDKYFELNKNILEKIGIPIGSWQR